MASNDGLENLRARFVFTRFMVHFGQRSEMAPVVSKVQLFELSYLRLSRCGTQKSPQRWNSGTNLKMEDGFEQLYNIFHYIIHWCSYMTMGSWAWLFSSKMEDSRPCLEGCRSPLFQGSVALETCGSSGIGRGAGFCGSPFWWFLMFLLMVLMVCFFWWFFMFFWWFLENMFDLFDGWSQLYRWSTEI